LGLARRKLAGSLLWKGLLVIVLPVLALVSCLSLVLVAEHQRTQAHVQREAAEHVEESVAALRVASRAAGSTFSAYLTTRDATTGQRLAQQRATWEQAVDALKSAGLAQPDRTLQQQVRALGAASDELRAVSDQLVTSTGPGSADLYARAAASNTSYEDAIQAISDRAAGRARALADAYDASSVTISRLIVISAVVGAAGAIGAMILFAVTIRRRVRRLEHNARALGAGQPMAQLSHSQDELGQLGCGLDEAATLLGDRAAALHDAAETLAQSEQRLALALAAGAMGAWDVDLRSGVSTWDDQTQADHGLAPGAFGGTFEAWLDLVHPDDRAGVMSDGASAQATGAKWTTEYRINRPDEPVRWIETSGQSLLDSDGIPVRLVGVSSDVTERKLAADKLRAAIADAQLANRTKNEFLSRVSHELRTPLNAILGFGQLLELDDLQESQRESVEQVLRGGRHLLALIDDVLDISRIESGDLPMSIEATSLEELLHETTALVSGAARSSDIAVVIEPSAWLGSHVMTDRRRLKQILLNLLSNGVKYNHPGGRVSLRCESSSPGLIQIRVTDTGPGIPADQVPRLFTPFDRLGAESTSIDGTGIGLALSQRLAEMLGTSLTVDTEVGVGTTFALEVPVANDPVLAAVADLAPDQRRSTEHGQAGTVLYVEDNPSNLRLVQRLLDRRGGIQLLSATTGAMALSLAARVPVDVILLDLHLPDMHGAEVLSRLREHPLTAHTPVIVVSADASPGQRERLRAVGADSFLSKPFDLGAFAAELDTHLAEVAAT
jgi:signal transduction histidine kinase/ActR/RegA family two-component response regulator